MAKFIELPIGDGHTALVNLDRVCEIRPNYKYHTETYDESATTIYFSNEDTSYFAVPFADIRRMILAVTGQEDGNG